MGCQRRIAREIIEADADYVLALKGKQPAAQEEISAFLDDAIVRKQPALDYSADSQGTELNGAKIRPVWVVLRRRCFGAGDCPSGVWAG